MSCVWVFHVEYRSGFFRRYCDSLGACLSRQRIHVLHQYLALFGRIAHIIYGVKWTRILRFSVSVLTQNGEVCSADASALCPGMRARTWKRGNYFYEIHVAETRDDGEHFSLLFISIFRTPPVYANSSRQIAAIRILSQSTRPKQQTNSKQTTNNKQQVYTQAFPFVRSDLFSVNFMWAAEGAAHAGAAKRRRARRHRAYLKKVRMSVAMALSEYKHHTSRGQRMDRAGWWERAAQHGHVLEHPTHEAAGTEHFSLDVEDVRCVWTAGAGFAAHRGADRRLSLSSTPPSRRWWTHWWKC